MTTDRELLEKAAKAVGLWDAENGCIDIPWNPLNDDGDALRLMAKLRIDLCRPNKDHDAVCAWVDHLGDFMEEPEGDDPYAATRRAIVRAAAAIGEQMQ